MFLGLAMGLIPVRERLWNAIASTVQILRGRKTIADRVEQFGPLVRGRLIPEFKKLNVAYPPNQLILIGFKQEKVLEVWVSNPPKLLKTYPILGASGSLGPKLQEGDMQVPEGLYRIESLNPNSRYHLSLRISYPNPFDKMKGKLDGRENLGGDIMIHGKSCSIGCLAMGDDAAEDLFILAAETGIENISIILSPVDFRKRELPAEERSTPGWKQELYHLIKVELLKIKTGN